MKIFLSKECIRINVTLCFSAGQALLAAKAGAYIISPFIGRLDDNGWEGVNLEILFNRPLTDSGLAQFLTDYSKVAQETEVLSR